MSINPNIKKFTAHDCTRRITTKKMYRMYCEDNPGTTISYRQYKDIIIDCNKEITRLCLEGGAYNFGNHIGYLLVMKFEKKVSLNPDGTPKNLSIDHGATRKHKSAGGTSIIYHPNGMKVRWVWTKQYCNIPNKSVWKLQLTDGPKGIKRKLAKHIKENPLAMNKYQQIIADNRKSTPIQIAIKDNEVSLV